MVGHVVGEGVRLAVGGSALGTVGALVLVPFLDTLVYGVGVRDPVTFAVVPLAMIGVAAMAAYLPTRRATPM